MPISSNRSARREGNNAVALSSGLLCGGPHPGNGVPLRRRSSGDCPIQRDDPNAPPIGVVRASRWERRLGAEVSSSRSRRRRAGPPSR